MIFRRKSLMKLYGPFYERWCKAFDKRRNHGEKVRRFKLFRHQAMHVHEHDMNTYLPRDPEDAAIYIEQRREVKLLLSKGEHVSNFDECYIPMELGPFADGDELRPPPVGRRMRATHVDS